MVNPQGSEAAAWIAGLWLADGHFSLNKQHGKDVAQYSPVAVLAGTDSDHIEMAYDVLREHDIGAHMWKAKRLYANQKKIPVRVGVHSWGKVRKFVDLTEPFLVGRKHLQALILRDLSRYASVSKGRPVTDEGWAMREWAYRLIRSLNRGLEPSETIITAPPYPVEDEGIVQALREIQG